MVLGDGLFPAQGVLTLAKAAPLQYRILLDCAGLHWRDALLLWAIPPGSGSESTGTKEIGPYFYPGLRWAMGNSRLCWERFTTVCGLHQP